MKVLIVVDMQNDFIDGALGSPAACEIVEGVDAYVKSFVNLEDSSSRISHWIPCGGVFFA